MKTLLIIFLFPLICFSQTKVMVNGLGGNHDSTVAECVKSAYPQAVVSRSVSSSFRTLNIDSIYNLGIRIIVRSTEGAGSTGYFDIAQLHPEMLFVMPAGSNSHVQINGLIRQSILLTGCGTDTNITAYPIDFFVQDPTGQNLSSYSNGYIAGVIAKLCDTHGITPQRAVFWLEYGKTLGHDGYGRIGTNLDYYEKYHRKIFIK